MMLDFFTRIDCGDCGVLHRLIMTGEPKPGGFQATAAAPRGPTGL